MKNNYTGIQFMTFMNNLLTIMFFIIGLGAIQYLAKGDTKALVGLFILNFGVVMYFRSTIELMTAIREIAMNTRK